MLLLTDYTVHLLISKSLRWLQPGPTIVKLSLIKYTARRHRAASGSRYKDVCHVVKINFTCNNVTWSANQLRQRTFIRLKIFVNVNLKQNFVGGSMA